MIESIKESMIPLFIKILVIYRLDLPLPPFIDFLLLRYPTLPAVVPTAPAYATLIPPSNLTPLLIQCVLCKHLLASPRKLPRDCDGNPRL